MKIKMLETSYQVSNRARTKTIHSQDRIYEMSEDDAKRIVESGAAVYAEEGEENPPKPTPKKKKKKSKNVVEPPIADTDIDPAPESEDESDG